ncbi:MAG: 30S ribosomal protein S1 [Anaerolinea sp.]|nr:30S ribosomal protein S1 [Anaerolinea sp.]
MSLMVNNRVAEDEIHLFDDGWWASVLAEEEGGLKPASVCQSPVAEHGKTTLDWERVKTLYRQDQIVAMTVTGYNRGGLLVEGGGLFGFVPCSHLLDLPAQVDEDRREACLAAYLGRELRLKVIECDPAESRIVFSERAARAEPGKRAELFKSLQAGQRVSGDVTNVTEFGAFVDLGGLEGLIHISELSWGRVTHPRQILGVGQRVEVLVLEVAQDRCRVALSLKRLSPNPWETAAQRYFINQVVPALITTLAPFGAFARLDEGVEGLIHASEIPIPPNATLKDVLTPGQDVQVRILQVDTARQRLGLSLKLVE